jgi:hypothetical protein
MAKMLTSFSPFMGSLSSFVAAHNQILSLGLAPNSDKDLVLELNNSVKGSMDTVASANKSIQRGVCCMMNYLQCCNGCAAQPNTTETDKPACDICMTASASENTSPPLDARITLRQIGGANQTHTAKADKTGKLHFTNLRPGQYEVDIHPSDQCGYAGFHSAYVVNITNVCGVEIDHTDSLSSMR